MATVLAPPVVPDIDDRPQRLIQLSNGLICLLICDMKSLISAAAMTVGCGQMDDPPEVQGLAHFTEHMVFLGSDKYPDEDEFDRFCATHNGHSNAYTAMHNTTFYFELSRGGLQGSLDRFSGFFECPTFKESCSDREMKAVDNEKSIIIANFDATSCVLAPPVAVHTTHAAAHRHAAPVLQAAERWRTLQGPNAEGIMRE